MTDAPAPRLGAVTVNWNAREDTAACVQSILDAGYPNLDLIVCDNASSDGSVALLRERFPQITVLEAGGNRGWCGGVNLGGRLALERGCDYLLILNNDTLLPPELIPRLLQAHRSQPRAGLVTARERLYHDPQRGDRLGARFIPLTHRVRWVFAAAGNRDPLPSPWPTDCVSCCAALTSRAIAEQVGLLDEDYFIYWEDVDWSLRVRRAGYQNLCLTDTMIVHKSGASLADRPGLSLPQLYLVVRGQAMLVRKHARGLCRVVAVARLLAASLVAALRGLLQSSYRPQGRAKLRGAWDGWRLAPPSAAYLKR